MKIDVYADIVCPWCYIGERRLGAALVPFAGREHVTLEFRPYQLDPNAPAAAVPLPDYLKRRFGQASTAMLEQVSKAAANDGIRFNWDAALMVNTVTAHRLLWLALREYGAATQRLLVNKLFEAHFTLGLNVADRETLTGLAESAGLSAKRAAQFLAGAEGLDDVRREMAAAGQRGVQAVPTFVLDDRYVVQGAQPVAVFTETLERAATRRLLD